MSMIVSVRWWHLAGICLLLAISGVGAKKKGEKGGFVKTSYQREMKITHEDANSLVKKEINILIETDQEVVIHYELPMDRIVGSNLANPSRLNATVTGSPSVVRGVRKNAVQVNGKDSSIHISRTGTQADECFTDLDACRLGYTLAFWVNFGLFVGADEYVYLTNGGHDNRNHGVAMFYNRGALEFLFKKKNGEEWRVYSEGLTPNRWYHLLATWNSVEGLYFYVDGELISEKKYPDQKAPTGRTAYNDFVFGRPNDDSVIQDERPMIVDEFHFWSEYKSADEVMELGPTYMYGITMDDVRAQLEGGVIPLNMVVGGNPSIIKGKVGNALEFDGRQDYIFDDFTFMCLGDLSNCLYGVSFSAWMKFTRFVENMCYLSTGSKGIKLYFKNNQILVEAQQGNKFWQANWTKPEIGVWYYVEFSWNPDDGLTVYADQVEVGRDKTSTTKEAEKGMSYLNVGRGGIGGTGDRYAAVAMDDLELWYGDRNLLIYLNNIIRGKPPRQYFSMNELTANNKLSHPNISITTVAQPRIVDGRVGGALNLDGSGQYVSFGSHHDSCFGNLDLCRHGMLLSLWLKPGQLREGMDILSTGMNGIRAWYTGGKFKVSARTSNREWTVQTDKVKTNEWHFVEIGMDRIQGLMLYVNNELAAESNKYVKHKTSTEGWRSQPELQTFYLGRGDGSRSYAKYGNATFDDIEYWYGNRDYLLAFGYIQRGRPERIYFDMDTIRSNKLVHSTLNLPIYGNPTTVSGKVKNGVKFDGSRQYLDIGDHSSSCLGNAELCNYGLTSSMWINFNSFQDKMYYFSSGGGIKMYYSNRNLVISVESMKKRWEAKIPNLKTGTWYFVEYTWHADKGLRLFLDNKQVAESIKPFDVRPKAGGSKGRVYIGGANPSDTPDGKFRYADAIIDEVEFWSGDRDYLMSFNYILRVNVTYIVFPFEVLKGNKILHPDYNIFVHNGATLTTGKVGNGTYLEGAGEYLTFGDQRQSCLGNIELCPHGLTIAMFLKMHSFPNKGYILASGTYSIYSKHGSIFARFSTASKTWEVSTNRIQTNTWQQLEATWDETKGLEMFVDRERVASTSQYTDRPPIDVTDYTLYIGRPTEDNADGLYGDAEVDELEYWYAGRDHLDIRDDVSFVILDMDRISGGKLVHPSVQVLVVGDPTNVPAVNATGVLLSGQKQFLNASKDLLCGGRLENCKKGFTLRFKIKPMLLLENTYFVSSAPVDIFSQNRRLMAEVRTPSTVWRGTSPTLAPNAWHQVDISWHPVDGLDMFINSERVYQQPTGTRNSAGYDINKQFFIGRANTNMRNEFYANAIYDDFQIWEAKREYLLSRNLISPETIEPETTPATTSTTTTMTTTTTTTMAPTTTKLKPPGLVIPSIPPGSSKQLVFDGSSWILYDFSLLPDEYRNENYYERLSIKIQTNQSSGLLWFNGDENNNVHLSLKNGILYLITTKDGTTIQNYVTTRSSRLDDSKWHDVYITRTGRQVVVDVDGNQYQHRLNHDITFVYPAVTYLAGSEDTYHTTNMHINSNFKGTIREAIISGNTLPSDLDLKGLSMLRPIPRFIEVNGEVKEELDESLSLIRPSPIIYDVASEVYVKPTRFGPIMFTLDRLDSSFLYLPPWQIGPNVSIQFMFKTTEPHGMIMYNGGERDFVVIELFDGIMYFIVDFGDGVQRYSFGTSTVSVCDGLPHSVKIEIVGRILRLTMDVQVRVYTFPGTNQNLDLGRYLYLGGVGSMVDLPWYAWTSNPKFYRGCIWELKFNDEEKFDLPMLVQEQRILGIESSCKDMPSQCGRNPCWNGVCRERWNDFECDCSDTSYTDTVCRSNAPLASFNGQDFVQFKIRPKIRSHTNDITLRFKTPKDNGLLLIATSTDTDEYMKIFLENGDGKVETNLGDPRRPTRLAFQCQTPLNDNRWHTVHIKRRANYLEAYIEECPKSTVEIPNDGYTFDIDKIRLGRADDDSPTRESFIGYLQNFNFNNQPWFEYLDPKKLPPNIEVDTTTNTSLTEKPIPVHSVTFRNNSNAHITMPALQIVGDTNVRFMFKTKERDGLILYNAGSGRDFFAVELSNGKLHVLADDGNGPQVVVSTSPLLNDDQWHAVEVVQTSQNTFVVTVDDKYKSTLTFRASRNTLDLIDVMYVGGVTDTLRHRLPDVINSKKGFSGCFASLMINNWLYDLLSDSITSSHFVTSGCTNTTGFCSTTGASALCRNGGVCVEALDGFTCDCNMTSYKGRFCNEEAEGYRFGERTEPGIIVFKLRDPQDTNMDRIAFGFMMWQANGSLIRIDSDVSRDFIEAKLVNGHVVVVYDLGDGRQQVVESRRQFNDGQYHHVTFVRNGNNATIQVDDFPTKHHTVPAGGGGDRIFNEMVTVKIGGNLDLDNNIVNYLDGIISSVYINGYRIIDLGVQGKDSRVKTRGDVTVASHPFFVAKQEPPVVPTKPTDGGKPPIIVIPPDGGQTPYPPGGAKTPEPPIIPEKPDVPENPDTGAGVFVPPPGVDVPEGAGGVYPPGVDGTDPEAGAIIGGSNVAGAGVEEGARAAAIAGAMIGVLLLASSLMWALYKFKPGLIGATKPPVMNISGPTLNSPLLGAAGAGAGGSSSAAAGSGAGSGAGAGVGAGGGGAGAGSGTTTLTKFFPPAGASGGAAGGAANGSVSNVQVSVVGGAGGSASGAGFGAGGGSGTMQRGIQTDMAPLLAPDQQVLNSTMIRTVQTSNMMVDGGGFQGAGYQSVQSAGNAQGAGYLQGSGYAQGAGFQGAQGSSFYQAQMIAGYQSDGYGSGYQSSTGGYQGQGSTAGYQQTLGSGQALGAGQAQGAGYLSNYVSNSYEGSNMVDGQIRSQAASPTMQMSGVGGSQYAMSNMDLIYSSFAQQELYNQQRLLQSQSAAASAASTSGGGPMNLMAAEEIRVDCMQMTNNGRFVVTGSIYGPPQVWDMKTGELIRVMKGEDFSSTDLHLANGDTLLVGQVAELEQVDPSDANAMTRLHHRKLQIWDFETGRPLEMRKNELCTASCMMNDGERIVLGRTEKYGAGTTIIIWDILGNEPVRHLKCDASVGFADYISYLNMSKDSQYVIAGFQNSFDQKANFITFDLAASDHTSSSVKVIAFDAAVEVTAILENHEVVTGTRHGDLTIWSMKTGKELRRLVSPAYGTTNRREAYSQSAHQGEVKDLAISKDGQLLVSASADHTLKMWNLDTEKLIQTLTGHKDEVWCCTISNDNELIASGSRDNTIRLWRADDGTAVAAINAGMNVFKVMLSNNKKTIVALGDRAAARKLIMLKVVRNVTKETVRTATMNRDGNIMV